MAVASPDILLAAVRAVHFVACIVIFGELSFARVIDARSVVRARVVAWSALVAAVSAVAWLGMEAMLMSGEGVALAWTAGVLRRVLLDTQFGQAWLARMALLVVVVVVVRRVGAVSLGAAAALLGGLAWMGHAGAAAGAERAGELAADAAHLLAAGAWLGTLGALAAALRRDDAAPARAALVRRYGRYAVLAVAVVLFTGVVNARFRVGTLDALVDSDYGRILLVKLALVAAMLALAAVNRWVITPRLMRDAHGSAAQLRRNALVEAALGLMVIALVGVLGITPPAAMDMPPMVH